MDLVKNDTTIQVLENIPYPTLNPNASWRPYLNLPDFTQLPHYEQQGWRLCSILFDRQQQQRPTPSSLSQDTTTEPSQTKAEIIQKQTFDFKRWLIQTVSSNAEPALQVIKKQEPNDSYAEIFTCMTFGRIHEATSIAMKKMDDYVLAIFLASPLSPENAIRQRNKLSKEKLKNKYHEKIWRLLSGQVDSELTDGLDWKQAFMLYIMYGKTRSGEDPLNTLIERYLNDTRKLGKTIKERDSSPWYNMIQWWWQRTYNCQKLNTVDISGWPARLAWRFILMFQDELSTTLVTSIIQRWCMELQAIGLSKWAIFSSLFTSK
ncbi:hypothetical protein INT45_001941 [Circinella minor]|uniref:Nuclear pore complex protein NUP96 C-terminal domain-containing protein n=1 Tax=Circinella minor TaxID=1195481 RepID=A0A8H7VLZ1_9FUNG|nr:hypothetical protein INT45_001941 [Circinella minor]